MAVYTGPTAEELRQLLLSNGGSVTATAAVLKVNRVTVHKWMRRHGIYLERRPVAPVDGAGPTGE
jgi:transcriptional regulator of acetoin/glycerol metabolism